MFGVLIVLLLASLYTAPMAQADYPVAPVVVAPTVNNQQTAKTSVIDVNANLDDVKNVSVLINGKTVKAEVTSDGSIVVGTLIGPKDKVTVKLTTNSGVVSDVKVDYSVEQISLANVNFAVGSSNLSKDAIALLTRVANIVKTKGFKNISLIGFTDTDGARKNNEKLSLARAVKVRQYLLSLGVTANFSVDAQADDSPVADNNTKQGKALNRRVEIVVS